MTRVVLDTNVLVSSLLAPGGNEASVLLAVGRGLVVPCFSEEVLAEYRGVLGRPKFSFPSYQIVRLTGMLEMRGELVPSVRSGVVSPDVGDTKFLDCAFASLADFLVTGNKRHFPEGKYGSTLIVYAGELLLRIPLDV